MCLLPAGLQVICHPRCGRILEILVILVVLTSARGTVLP